MFKQLGTFVATLFLSATPMTAYAWDHPGHMTTAALAFSEIERVRPDLIETLGLVMLKHPDIAPFWVATGGARGKERIRRMFIETARWADDTKWSEHDRPTWHTARWPMVLENAPSEARKLAEMRNDKPRGSGVEAGAMNAAILANPESNPVERALALSWVMHIVGDLHQPLHVTDVYSKENPTGNVAGTMDYVWDPLRDSAMPFHVLWDSNTFRSTKLEDIDQNVDDLLAKYPRSSLSELQPYNGSGDIRLWARESYQVAVEFAYGYGIETVGDPNKDGDTDRIIANMVKYMLDGVSPIKEAPKVPTEYWEELQDVAHRRIALAGYRIADIIIAAADQISADKAMSVKVLDATHGAPN